MLRSLLSSKLRHNKLEENRQLFEFSKLLKNPCSKSSSVT